MLEVCKQLFYQWNESDVRYCHWKSNEHLMEGLDGKTDLDVRRADRYMEKGGIPLYDRFPQTQFEGIYDGPKINHYCQQRGISFGIVRWMAKREQHYIEKIQDYQPRLVFKLMLSPEESIRRKPSENLEVVTRKHNITSQLKFPHSLVHTVDATMNYQEEIIYIKNQIWNELIWQNIHK